MTRIGCALMTALFVGCATHVRTAQPNVQGPVDSPAARVTLNETNVRCSYSAEWQFNRSGSKDAPPELGVALSGGGMRAASYAIGALSALNKLGYLNRTDVLSTVSGGAYAAGWYVSQRAASDDSDDDLFRDCAGVQDCYGDYQHHLADHGKLINRRRVAFALLTDVALFPANLLLNGVFGWHKKYYRASTFL